MYFNLILKKKNLEHDNVAKLLIENNADVNLREKYLRTPLHSAIEKGIFN